MLWDKQLFQPFKKQFHYNSQDRGGYRAPHDDVGVVQRDASENILAQSAGADDGRQGGRADENHREVRIREIYGIITSISSKRLKSSELNVTKRITPCVSIVATILVS